MYPYMFLFIEDFTSILHSEEHLFSTFIRVVFINLTYSLHTYEDYTMMSHICTSICVV
jgi:hypothetical protein